MQQIILNKLRWIEELLPIDVIPRNMKGGIGYYLDDLLVLIVVESGQTYEHKGISYPFKIWNGCFFPIIKLKQNAVFAKFQFLENHPALKDSLYLPADSEDFAEQMQMLLREIKKRNPLFGIHLKQKNKVRSIPTSDDAEMDTSQPHLFDDAPVVRKAKAKEKQNPQSSVLNKNKKAKVSKKNENDLLLAMIKRKK